MNRSTRPSPEGALWSSPRERAAGVLPGAGALGNLTIDDSALNGAAWELEAHTAQAPSLPRAAGVTVLPHLGCAHSFLVHLENGNAEGDAADDTPGLSARLRCAWLLAQFFRGAQCLRRLLWEA